MIKRITTRTWVGFLAGIALGATVWWASPYVVGKAEPWDASVPYYPLALFIAGFLAALIDPLRFWVSVFGIYVGQFLYAFLFLPSGPLWIVGMMFGAMYLLCSIFGGLITHGLWQFGRRKKKPEIEHKDRQRSSP